MFFIDTFIPSSYAQLSTFRWRIQLNSPCPTASIWSGNLYPPPPPASGAEAEMHCVERGGGGEADEWVLWPMYIYSNIPRMVRSTRAVFPALCTTSVAGLTSHTQPLCRFSSTGGSASKKQRSTKGVSLEILMLAVTVFWIAIAVKARAVLLQQLLGRVC